MSLSCRVAPERRAELLAFLADAFPLYEQPGGIRMGLYESVDEPGLLLELVAYAGEAEYVADQERVTRDPRMAAALQRWRSLLAAPPDVRRMRPVLLEAPPRPRAAASAVDVEEAGFADHDAIAALLTAAGLPVPGAQDAPVPMLVVRALGGVAGCAGWERHGAGALLRSLAVRPDHRQAGVGSALVAAVCARLAARGLREVFLLTNDAESFFARQGFEAVERATAAAALNGARALSLACCAQAVAMRRTLSAV